MGKKVTPETALKRSIRDYAGYIGLRVWSIMGGLGQEPGIADFIGIYKGKPVAIEAKSPTGRLTAFQEKFQQEWERHGGIYILARRVEDVANALGLNTQLWG